MALHVFVLFPSGLDSATHQIPTQHLTNVTRNSICSFTKVRVEHRLEAECLSACGSLWRPCKKDNAACKPRNLVMMRMKLGMMMEIRRKFGMRMEIGVRMGIGKIGRTSRTLDNHRGRQILTSCLTDLAPQL